VVARPANTLGHELIKAEASKGAHSKNPDVIDLVMRGWALMGQGVTSDSNAAARGWFQQALRIEANNPTALAGEALTYLTDYSFGWTAPGTDHDQRIRVPSICMRIRVSRRSAIVGGCASCSHVSELRAAKSAVRRPIALRRPLIRVSSVISEISHSTLPIANSALVAIMRGTTKPMN
jgi:hypothetical protein